MSVYYKPLFRKFVKKQTRPFQLVIEDEVERIILNPDMGEAKKGDLAGFQVHKFTHKRQKFLIAYRLQDADVVFFKIGSHENFYRELKNISGRWDYDYC